MSTRLSSILAAFCGILGVVILGVYYSGVLVPQLPAADPHPTVAQLAALGTQNSSGVFVDAWFLVTGALLSVVFFLALIQLAGAVTRFAGRIMMLASAMLMATVIGESTFTIATAQAVLHGHPMSALTIFDLTVVFIHIFLIGPAPLTFLALGAVLLGSRVLPRVFGYLALALGIVFEILGFVGLLTPIAVTVAIYVSRVDFRRVRGTLDPGCRDHAHCSGGEGTCHRAYECYTEPPDSAHGRINQCAILSHSKKISKNGWRRIVMGYDFLYDVHENIATITLNRPDVMNALTFEVYAQLRDLFEQLRYDEAVRVVILTGAGENFCSGGDVHQIIGELLKRDTKGHLEFTRMTGAVVQNMRLLAKPIIAALNGMTAGAGAVLALASDLRIASEKARFAFLFTRVGLTGADMGAGYLLPRVVGLGRASELLLFGDTIDAATAERYGLVNRVVPHAELLPAAHEWASRLAQGPTQAIAMTKYMLNAEMHMDLVSAIEAEAQAQALMLMGEDHRRFYEAFQAKEKPKFVGR